MLVARRSLHLHCGLQTKPKKKLTQEEAAQAAEDLRKKIKAKNQVRLKASLIFAHIWGFAF